MIRLVHDCHCDLGWILPVAKLARVVISIDNRPCLLVYAHAALLRSANVRKLKGCRPVSANTASPVWFSLPFFMAVSIPLSICAYSLGIPDFMYLSSNSSALMSVCVIFRPRTSVRMLATYSMSASLGTDEASCGQTYITI